MPPAKRKAAAPTPNHHDTRPVSQRGQEYQAVKLTGNEASVPSVATCVAALRAGPTRLCGKATTAVHGSPRRV